ncbi:PAS domain S-box protein [Desulfogranum marinum]|uniref:PAS domain S-box protein n=1 Tax=Desulfogranum marinum TaxID=453220 RepID=UPI0019628F8B|nr:PAS domain S-box protein [Desulfogranum marinum]MBM9512517.1 PAS domain S-box protein [Desulfogranum marinum]
MLWAQLTVNAAQAEDGPPVCYLVLSDITGRKQAEEKARESERILRDIVENTLSGFWDWNLVDSTEYLSPSFKRMFGYLDHEMESSPEAWQRIIFSEDLPGVFEVFDRHVESRGREPFYNEVRFKHRDGSTIWVICTGRIIEWAEDGTPIRMVGCHVDITDRKKAEAALDRQNMVDKAAAEVFLKLLGAGSFEEISHLLLEKATQLTGSLCGFAGYMEPFTERFVASTFTRNISDGCRVADKTVVFEKPIGLWDWVVNNRLPLISNHPESDHRSSGFPQGHIPIRRFLGVPVLHGEELVGMIALANSEEDYSDQDMAVVERLSTIYALSIQKSRTEEVLKRINDDSEKKQREHIGMLKALVDISSGFINVPPDKTDDIVVESLQAICLLVDADRSYVFSYDFSKQTTSNTYEWCRDGIEPQIEYLQNIPLELIPDWVKNHRAGSINYIPDVMGLSPESDIRQLLEPQGIKSIISVPLMRGDTCVGFVGFDSVHKHHNYTDKEQSILEVFSLMLINLHKRNESSLELTRAKDYAEQSEEKFRQIAENVGEVIWLRSADNSKMLYINPAYEKVWGRTSESLYNNPESFIDSVYDPDKPAVFAAFEKLMRTNTFDEVYRIVRPDGKIRWIHSKSFPVRDRDGDILKHTGIAIDITERKKAEEALRTANIKLQSSISRAKEFAQKAEAATKAKSLFLSNMSHELRTPLNAVIGFSQLLAKDPMLTERQHSDVQVVLRSGQDLLEIVNDILEISRIEAGRLEIRPVNFSIHELLMDLERLFRSRCEAKGLHLVVERDDHLPEFLYGDRTKLKQVVTNLLSNAIKFTEKGGISVRVRSDVYQEKDLPRKVRVKLTIEVEDSGIGISLENLEAIFRPFDQVESAANTGGNGLGLAICREYAALLGGDIRVVSEPGRGSCFCFTGEMTQGKAVPGTGAPAYREVIGLESGTGPVRILVVEDDPDNQVLVKALLAPIGFEVYQAFNGKEALALFKKIRPAAVLMDMRMPDMDGYEATRQIKCTAADLATPVIALTASVFEEGKQKILDAGADAYLRKPFLHRELYEILGQCLGLRYVHKNDDQKLPTLTVEAISELSEALRTKLRQAVEDGDMVLFMKLLEQAAESSPELARKLRKLADVFDYPRINALLAGKGVPSDEEGHSPDNSHAGG